MEISEHMRMEWVQGMDHGNQWGLGFFAIATVLKKTHPYIRD